MSDVEKYIAKSKVRAFAKNVESGYDAFEFCVMPKQAQEIAGVTQEVVARRLRTKKSAISRVENNLADIRLSTLERYAMVLGKKSRVQLVG